MLTYKLRMYVDAQKDRVILRGGYAGMIITRLQSIRSSAVFSTGRFDAALKARGLGEAGV